MLSNFLKAKLHMASVTQAELWYDGSCAIDAELLALSGMREFEQIDIYNVTNGERFTTTLSLLKQVLALSQLTVPRHENARWGIGLLLPAMGSFLRLRRLFINLS